MIVGHEGSQERPAEYFAELYDVSPPTKRLASGDPRVVLALNPPIRDYPYFYLEVKSVVSELR